jgi:hypothetical protein
VEDCSSQRHDAAPRWDLRFPGRLQKELDAFSAEGVNPTVDEGALQDGRLVLDFQWPFDGSVLPLRAVYPDSFPFLRPQVILLDRSRSSGRHIASDGTLCLIGRDSRQWTSSLTVPALLRERLADALTASGVEDPQGEPAEFWWNGSTLDDLPYCLVETTWELWAKGIDSGRLTIKYTLEDSDKGIPRLRAVMTKVVVADGAVLFEWSGRLPSFFVGREAREVTIPWERLERLPLPDENALRTVMDTSKKASSSPNFSALSLSTRRYRLNAFLYPSELEWKRQGDAWLFALFWGGKQSFLGRKPLSGGVVRTLRAGAADLTSRAPQVAALATKKICVIGVGAIGATLAIEMARNGVTELRLLDSDIVEPGNSVRWPLGASAWGQSKVAALAEFIASEYPNCQVSCVRHLLGTQSPKYPFRDEKALSDATNGVDLVIDATAAYWNMAYIHDFVGQQGLRLMAMHASPPVTGGVVVFYGPNGGCPACLLRAWDDGSIPEPPGIGDESGLAQPPGCAERTFAGVSYDLQEISLHAMRVASAFLVNGSSTDLTVVHTLSFDVQSGVKLPSWRAETLSRHTDCRCAT